MANRIQAVCVVTIVVIYGLAAKFESDERAAANALYCANVGSGKWTDYRGSYSKGCGRELYAHTGS